MPSLRPYNTFGIDAQCHRFINYHSVEELVELLPSLRDERWFHIGGGSNLIFSTDYPGTILHSAITSIDIIEETPDTVTVKVGAGYVWDAFVAHCIEQGYYGIENLSYIPGEVGASAVQNIGAYGVEAADCLDRIYTIDVASLQPRVFSAEECHYAYRHSIFKEYASESAPFIITHVAYRLQRTFRPNLTYRALADTVSAAGYTPETLTAQHLRSIITNLRRSKLPEVGEIGSAGSFFMNPIVPTPTAERLRAAHPNMPYHPVAQGVKLSAAWLIDQCGWKGRRWAHVGVYERQPLVLINTGGATGADVIDLCHAIQHDVAARFDIQLQPEAIFVGDLQP